MKFIVSLFVVLFGMSVVNAADTSWQKFEHNVKLKHGDWGLEVRTYTNDDYDHYEITNSSIINNVELGLRVAEDADTTEYRAKATHKLFDAGALSLNHRMEYRYFEGNTTDDYWRYRLIAKAKMGDAWLKFQPRWKFGGDNKNDSKIDDVKYTLGYNLALSDNVVLTPFAEYVTAGETGDWKKQELIGGTTLEVKF